MSWMTTLLRRVLLLAVLGASGGALYSWWRARNSAQTAAPPEWPPLDTSAPTGKGTPSGTASQGSSATSSVVNALVDAPAARPSGNGDATWVAPDEDGSCPVTHPIKANDNSGIFHVPGGQFYDRTGPERCYSSAEAAIADGYRQAKA